ARPLGAIDATEIAMGIRPFIPDGHTIVIEPFDIGIAAEKPEQLVKNRLGVDFLGGEQRERVAQGTADLCTKEGIGAGAGAVRLKLSVFQDVPQQIEILSHRGGNLIGKETADNAESIP